MANLSSLIFVNNKSEIEQIKDLEIITENHQRSYSMTQYNVETGTPVSDNSFINPKQITLTIHKSDILENTIGNVKTDQQKTWATLTKLADELTLFKLVTSKGVYNDMQITSIQLPVTTETGYTAINGTIDFEQRKFTKIEKTSLPASIVKKSQATKTGEIKRGKQATNGIKWDKGFFKSENAINSWGR